MNNFANIQHILKRNIPGYVDSKEMDSNIIVTIPKANSMFFRESDEFPLLQQLPSFSREGYDFFTEFEIKEGQEDFDYVYFKFNKKESTESFNWRNLLDVSEKNVSDDEDHMEFIRKIFN